MSQYRRYYVPGATYFFTVVTERRARLFEDAAARELLGNAIRHCRRRAPFETIATVLLPDHLHALWTLPRKDVDYSRRWSLIKRTFTIEWLARNGEEQPRRATRRKERRRAVWQRRFWEHLIRDARDLETHFDYIHFNPVKHGYVTSPSQWPWSTFHRYVASGHYALDWAKAPTLELPGNAGEFA